MSGSRPFLDRTHPDVHKAMLKSAATSRRAARETGLSDGLLELVNVRVSQINGCRACLSVHAPAARKAGIEQVKLDVLPSWREAEIFDEVEKSALRLAESLTVLDPAEDRDALAEQVGQHLSTEQVSAIEWTVVLINAFNRISIASNHPVVGPR